MSQRDVFLNGEGDAWYERNESAISSRILPEGDPLLGDILSLNAPGATEGARILEVGCGDGARLGWLARHRGCLCYGVDPSMRAVAAAKGRGVNAQVGTAEHIPFGEEAFDIVVFGFCLYLCDRKDLFGIAFEADRVLRSPGWLVILDFYSPFPTKRPYHHRPGLFAHKMDFRTLFSWHPAYMTYFHKVRHHAASGYTDDRGEWVATSVLRKNFNGSD